MALGDYGITPLQHAGGLATFANGGKLAKPYAILDLVSSKGELIYSRDRDEPEAPQVYEREHAEQMNWMLNKVITEGTGRRAQLDFTNVAGKTGTSTGPKDAWFVGFTGKYLGVVWLGNDDNRPMSGTTGGQFAAPVWHSFMSVVHTDMNIPNIPGLQPHPVQVAEQQRLAALKPEGALAGNPGDAQRASSSLMPEQTREALKHLTEALRKAAGLAEPATAPAGDGPAGTPGSAPAQPPDRRAQGGAPRIALPRDGTVGAVQPLLDETSRRALP
jgi:penicillin-binding protein 1A